MTHRRLGILTAIGVLAIGVAVPQMLSGAPSETDEVPSPDVLIRVVRPQAEPSSSPARKTGGSPVVSRTAPGTTGNVTIDATNNSKHANAQGGDTDFDGAGDESGAENQAAHHVEVFMERTTTADPAGSATDTPCPKSTTCERFQMRRARLPSTSSGRVDIPYRFNDEGRRNLRAPAGLLESAFRSGAQQWKSWNSNLNFVHQGTTTAKFAAEAPDGGCDDGTNVVTWHRFDPTVIAAVSVCTDDSGRVVRDVDLAMNVTQHWEDVSGEPDSRHSFDIRSIVTHEIGHWLSFADIYGFADSKQTMFGQADHGETGKRTLALGDIVGVQTAYPCGTGDSCPRTGIKND